MFDGIRYHSAAEVYSGTIVTYSYGKVLLAPGQRLGYIALPPTSPERPALRSAIELFQWATGYAFADAVMQHSVAELEDVSIDIGRMQARRDRFVGALRAMGYETTNPEGTFYVLVRTPIEDDLAFSERLAEEHDVLVLPGTVVELPGWVRVSLTASDEMVEQARPASKRRSPSALNPGGPAARHVRRGRTKTGMKARRATSGPIRERGCSLRPNEGPARRRSDVIHARNRSLAANTRRHA